MEEVQEKNLPIRMALLELTNPYEGLVLKQNEIYDDIWHRVDKMKWTQFKKHSDMVIQSQVLAGTV